MKRTILLFSILIALWTVAKADSLCDCTLDVSVDRGYELIYGHGLLRLTPIW